MASSFVGSIALCILLSVSTNCLAWSSVTPTKTKPIPITVLSGFLGAGKTTLLQNLLNNNEGLKIAVVVNDMASVNIDSKLVSGQNAAAGMVELQNGCACCSLSEELLTSVGKLVLLHDLREENDGFDHIVVEMSGISDPKGVRSKFQEAAMFNMPLMQRVQLDTMVTVVDCSTFVDHLTSRKMATRDEAPELFYTDGKKPESSGSSWMDEEDPMFIEALLAGSSNAEEKKESEFTLVDLLVSQTETSDVVLLNKLDLADETSRIENIVTALNPRCKLIKTKYGQVPLQDILAVAGGRGIVASGMFDDHTDAVQAASALYETPTHSHSHEHGEDCAICNDSSHSHSHNHAKTESHSHSHEHGEDCAICNDSSHSHSHNHAKTESHSHSHEHGEDCAICNDPSHSHAHSDHYAGISSFVYRARRPFHPGRLVFFLHNLPIARGLPPLPNDKESTIELSTDVKDRLKNVLRSKGFVWCANSNIAAMYLSHAGTSVEIKTLGRWWASLPRNEWPAGAEDVILKDFDSKEYNENDRSFSSVGDRRQEIVFIGTGMADNEFKNAFGEALDQCLLNDSEWDKYIASRNDSRKLEGMFPNPLDVRVMVS